MVVARYKYQCTSLSVESVGISWFAYYHQTSLQHGYAYHRSSPEQTDTDTTPAASGGEIVADFISTNVPSEVAHPHGRNSFALEDGVATHDPDFAKRASVDVEAMGERTASVVEREMYPLPTEEEARTLRKIADSIPYTGTAREKCLPHWS